MIDPFSTPPPGYWMHETSGVLRPVIEAYLHGQPMTPPQIATMRSYLRQWIAHPSWRGPEVDELRDAVHNLDSRIKIRQWLDLALDAGIDPL